MKNKFYHSDLVPDIDMPAEFVHWENRMDVEKPANDSSSGLFIPRRQFLKLSGLAGGGLVLAFSLGRGPKAAASPDKQSSGDNFAPNAFIQIAKDGAIVIAAKNPEVGQGVKTFLPMIVAEELEVPWESVTVKQSEIDLERFGRQSAGGSQSTPRNWDLLRQAGAVARTMLVTAAAQTWGVSESQCKADQGFVVNQSNGKRLAYAELASTAAALPIPEKDSVKLKDRSEYKLLGKFIPGVDNRALVTGQPLFGIDQQLPGMLYAVYVKCPNFGGVAKQANLDVIRKRPGVVDAFILKGNGNELELMSGVAIVAKSTHQAFQAEKALRVTWDKSNASDNSWEAYKAEALSIGPKAGQITDQMGDAEAALAQADQTVESFYTYPFLSHANLEPQNCTAWYHDGKMEIWAPSQTPQNVARMISSVLDIDPSDVLIHQLRIGGGFGRRLMNDFVVEVCAIAKQIDAPVKLTWTREADMAHDFYRPGGFHHLKGALSQGRWTGLLNHFVSFTPEGGDGKRPVRGGNLSPDLFQFPEIPNLRLDQTFLPSRIPTGYWRAPRSCAVAWVFQSFANEMAVAAGRDHLEFLLEQFGEPRWLEEGERRALHTGRAIDVVELAAKKGDWGKPMPQGRGRGLAFYFSHLGYFAHVAEVTVDAGNRVGIDRVVVAADVGMLLNKSGGENQVEGSVVDGISTLAGQEITFEDGEVLETNFDDYPLGRMASTPKIEMHWLTTDWSPTGLGEPAFPPVAGAVCNAIFDATGHRIRTMPISKEGFHI